jgi:uncharacterized OB-fold protein
MASTSKTCPQCGQTYAYDRRFCEQDGTELTEATESQADSAEPATTVSSSNSALSRETLAGGILVLALVLIVSAVFWWRESSVFRLKISFDEARGLKVGDSVFVRGADVGEVVKTQFVGGRFVADAIVRNDGANQLKQGCLFFVGYDKILMNRRCLVAYVPDPGQPALRSGEELRGVDSWFKYYGTLLKDKGPAEAMRAYEEMKGLLMQTTEAVGGKLGKP